MAAMTSPALPAFSYAQAAKGLAPLTPATNSQAESAMSTPEMSSTEKKPSIPESEKLDSLHGAAGAEKVDQSSNDVVSKTLVVRGDTASTVKSISEKDSNSNTKQTSSTHSDSKQVSETTSPSLVASITTLPREDEFSSTPNDSESWDKQSDTSTAAEKSVQMTDSGKEKSGDDDWINVPAPKVEKELKAAPIPVNFWQQRIEAQAAKAKANNAFRPATTVSAPLKTKPQLQSARHVEAQAQDDETKRRSSGKLADKGDGNSKKKQVDDTKTRDDGKCSFLLCKCCQLI